MEDSSSDAYFGLDWNKHSLITRSTARHLRFGTERPANFIPYFLADRSPQTMEPREFVRKSERFSVRILARITHFEYDVCRNFSVELS